MLLLDHTNRSERTNCQDSISQWNYQAKVFPGAPKRSSKLTPWNEVEQGNLKVMLELMDDPLSI